MLSSKTIFPKIYNTDSNLYKNNMARNNSNSSEIKRLRESVNILTDMVLECSKQIQDIKDNIDKNNTNEMSDEMIDQMSIPKSSSYKTYIASSIVLAISVFYYRYRK